MPHKCLGPALERCAIITGIVVLVILIAEVFSVTLTSDYVDMLAQQNLINTSLVTVTVLAFGFLCCSLFYFVYCRR